MNWFRAFFRLWVGGTAVLVLGALAVSARSLIEAPQTNDAQEFLLIAAMLAVVGLFGTWVLRGFKGQK